MRKSTKKQYHKTKSTRSAFRKKPQKVSTIREAVKAYGGTAQIRRAFRLPKQGPGSLDEWRRWNHVSKGYHLALFVGLMARGFEPTPSLFGVSEWDHMTGVRDIPWIETCPA